ncbi:MAG: YrhA family protein [Alphaproteobacteria bacterium]|nr:YrhA family protein [Alphaproteobacteria bacterium]
MLTDIIERIIDERDSSVELPANARNLTICQKEFTEHGLPEIPSGYTEFLKEANGLSWNGFEFYGTAEFSTDAEDEDIISLLEANQDFDEEEGKLLLGQSEEEQYVYNIATKKYEIVDSITGEEIESYASFEDLFTDLMENVLSAIDDDEEYEEDEDDLDFYDDEE